MTPSARRTTVLENAPYGRDHFRLCFAWDAKFVPGQFVMFGELARDAFIMPRAFSIYRGADGTADIVYKVVGRGTRFLADLRKGDHVLVWGPLGCGFEDVAGPELVVAGGIGIAGVFARIETLARLGETPALVFGARTGDDLVGVADLEPLVSEILCFTEDGTRGQTGRVTDGLAEQIRRGGFRALSACGPMPMLDAVAAIARAVGVRAQLSVEAPMACGLGACLGCSVAVGGRFLRACTEGPVFDAAHFGEAPRR